MILKTFTQILKNVCLHYIFVLICARKLKEKSEKSSPHVYIFKYLSLAKRNLHED
jgi:hypothetical protein